MTRFTHSMMAISVIAMGLPAYAQSEPDYAKMFAEFVAKTDELSVDIHVEEIDRVTGGSISDEIKPQLFEILNQFGLCAIQRELAYDTMERSKDIEDALRLRRHYTFYAQALERKGLTTKEAAEAAYTADKPRIEKEIRTQFAQVRNGDQAVLEDLDAFFKLCDNAANIVSKIEDAALKRNSGGN